MFLIYFALFVALNGAFTLEIALFGVGVSAVLYAFTVKFAGLSPRREWVYLRRVPAMLAYAGMLLAEIFKANMGVIRFVVSPKYEVEPQLVSFRTKLRSETMRVVLANSITLTPGTITVELQDDLLTVHCLDRDMAEGLENSVFEQRLLRIERIGEAKKA